MTIDLERVRALAVNKRATADELRESLVLCVLEIEDLQRSQKKTSRSRAAVVTEELSVDTGDLDWLLSEDPDSEPTLVISDEPITEVVALPFGRGRDV